MVGRHGNLRTGSMEFINEIISECFSDSASLSDEIWSLSNLAGGKSHYYQLYGNAEHSTFNQFRCLFLWTQVVSSYICVDPYLIVFLSVPCIDLYTEKIVLVCIYWLY